MGMGWHYRRSYETVLVAQKRGGACKWYDKSKRIENIIRPGAFGIKKLIPSAEDHPTQKPVALAQFFIKLHTQPGDIVLDPFFGSGSTGVAAKKLSRHFIGIELSAEYVKMASDRLRPYLEQSRLEVSV
jgi:DNA modification methylase